MSRQYRNRLDAGVEHRGPRCGPRSPPSWERHGSSPSARGTTDCATEPLDYRVARLRFTAARSSVGAALIGMSSLASEWEPGVARGGAGLKARRIFADLAGGPTQPDQAGRGGARRGHAAGDLVQGRWRRAGAVAGKFNAVAEQAAAKLASYGLPTAVTFWHEPYRRHDRASSTPRQPAAAADLQARRAARGPDPQRVAPRQPGRRRSRRSAPTTCSICGTGSASTPTSPAPSRSPGEKKPADRIPALAAYLESRARTCRSASVSTTATPPRPSRRPVRPSSPPPTCGSAACGTRREAGVELSGDRLDAFRETLADPRAGSPSP